MADLATPALRRNGRGFGGENLAAAIAADAERGLDSEFLGQIILERDPIALALELSAPAAHLQLFFEIIKPLQDPAGRDKNGDPDDNDHDGFDGGLAPVRQRGAAKDQLRQTNQFVEPGNDQQGGEPEAFDPQNLSGAALVFHFGLTRPL